MPVVADISRGAAANAELWRPLRNAIAGGGNYLTRHKNDSTTEAALEAYNANAASTAPVASLFANGLAGTKTLEALNSGITLRSPNSSHSMAMTNSGFAFTGTVTINGSTISDTLPVYNVANYGLVKNLAASAAANTTALQTLFTTVATAGGGIIFFPPGTWYLNPCTFNHGLTSTKVGIWMQGVYGSSAIYFNQAAGPFFQFATTSISPIQRCGMRDLIISHNVIPTSGATVKLGQYVNGFTFDNVGMLDSGAGLAPLIGVEAVGGFTMDACKVECRNDTAVLAAGGLVPIGILFNPSAANASGFHLTGGTDISGCSTRGYGVYILNTGTIVDTPVISDRSIIKDWDIGFRVVGNTGAVLNGTIADSYFDGCQTANVYVNPGAGGSFGAFTFDNVWCSLTPSAGGQYGMIFDGSTGTVSSVDINGCTFKEFNRDAINFGDSCSSIRIIGNTLIGDQTDATYVGIRIGNCANVQVTNNRVDMRSGSGANSITVSASATPRLVMGNLSRGVDISASGATSANLVTNNVYAA